MEKQINSLTSLRGIAALIVVVHHFTYFFLPKTGEVLSRYSGFFQNGYLCVDFFFILSGFIMTHVYRKYFEAGVSSDNYRLYLGSRFARIYPLHLFVTILFVGLEFTKMLVLHIPAFVGEFNLTALFANIFLLQAFDLTCPPLFDCNTYWNQPAWSISVEFFIYCIFPLLLFRFARLDRKFYPIVYVCTLILLLLLAQFSRGSLDLVGIQSLIKCGLECILGIITYRVYDRGKYQQYVNINLLSIISMGSIFFIMHASGSHLRSLHDVLILPAFSALILSTSLPNYGWGSRLLNSSFLLYLGTISYSIYMVHWLLNKILDVVWFYEFNVFFSKIVGGWAAWTTLGIYISLTIMVASLTYRFVEIPMRKLLKPKILAGA
jgi:peptidoglycan/LPS O-acetylase OafA/YrhL